MTQPSLIVRALNAVRIGFQIHGIWLPFVVLQRLWVYTSRKLFVSRTFVVADKQYHYVIHPFTLNNERTVEVAIACEFLRNKTGQILEVGNVLSNYSSLPHDVVDKYEIAPGVINEDIVLFSPGKKYDFIVTLSTLEHVGWDETPREPEKIVQAIARLKELLKDGGDLLVTIPLGYNSYADELVRSGETGLEEIRYLKRITANNQWREAQLDEVATAQYNSPFLCANAIMVGYFRKVGAS
jgi:hypothetical protein